MFLNVNFFIVRFLLLMMFVMFVLFVLMMYCLLYVFCSVARFRIATLRCGYVFLLSVSVVVFILMNFMSGL